MSADDHLSPPQFMPMDKVLSLKSPEWDDDGRALPGSPTVRDRFPSIERDIARRPGYYRAVERSMRTRGQTVPLAIDTTPYETGEPTLGHGHHRAYLAHKLGWEGVHVVSDPENGPEGPETEDARFNARHSFRGDR